MAIKKNMNEPKEEPQDKRSWQISLYIEGPKEAMMIADAEHFPRPDEDFDNYPTVVHLPESYSFFTMLKKVRKFSAMGIFSKATRNN